MPEAIALIVFDNKRGPVVQHINGLFPEDVVTNAFLEGQPEPGITVHAVKETDGQVFLAYQFVKLESVERNACMAAVLVKVVVGPLLSREVHLLGVATRMYFLRQLACDKPVEFEHLNTLVGRKFEEGSYKLFDHVQVQFAPGYTEAFLNEIPRHELCALIEAVMSGFSVVFCHEKGSLLVLLFRELFQTFSQVVPTQFEYRGDSVPQNAGLGFFAVFPPPRALHANAIYYTGANQLKKLKARYIPPNLEIDQIRRVINAVAMRQMGYVDVGNEMLASVLPKKAFRGFLSALCFE